MEPLLEARGSQIQGIRNPGGFVPFVPGFWDGSGRSQSGQACLGSEFPFPGQHLGFRLCPAALWDQGGNSRGNERVGLNPGRIPQGGEFWGEIRGGIQGKPNPAGISVSREWDHAGLSQRNGIIPRYPEEWDHSPFPVIPRLFRARELHPEGSGSKGSISLETFTGSRRRRAGNGVGIPRERLEWDFPGFGVDG